MIRTFITLLEDRSDATKEGYFDLTRRFGRISFLLRPCQVRDAHFDHALARTSRAQLFPLTPAILSNLIPLLSFGEAKGYFKAITHGAAAKLCKAARSIWRSSSRPPLILDNSLNYAFRGPWYAFICRATV